MDFGHSDSVETLTPDQKVRIAGERLREREVEVQTLRAALAKSEAEAAALRRAVDAGLRAMVAVWGKSEEAYAVAWGAVRYHVDNTDAGRSILAALQAADALVEAIKRGNVDEKLAKILEYDRARAAMVPA